MDYQNYRDIDLIDASLESNHVAFAELVSRYESKVAGIVFSFLGKNSEAEDIGQEVFIRFYENLGKFRQESSVGTFLVRMAINASLNALKKIKHKKNLQDAWWEQQMLEQEHQKETPDEVAMKNRVQIAIRQLQLEFQTVVVLRIMEGYSTKETAEILNIPVGTVLSRLSRAQKQLKDILSTPIKDAHSK